MNVNDTTRDIHHSQSNEKDHIFFLSKFFDKEKYALNFLNGRLYCNRLSYFMSLEEQGLPKRADQHEGVVAWGQPGTVRIEINGHDISNDLAAPASLRSNRLSDFNVLCMQDISGIRMPDLLTIYASSESIS